MLEDLDDYTLTVEQQLNQRSEEALLVTAQQFIHCIVYVSIWAISSSLDNLHVFSWKWTQPIKLSGSV